MQNIKLSVIIPVYNAEKYLCACLDSVLGQNLQNIEIICVDDGSTDRSASIIKQYAAKNSQICPFYINHQGVSAARNYALIQATGDWVIFCDSDDLVLPNAYNYMIAAALKHNADVVVGGMQILYNNKLDYFSYKRKQERFALFYSMPSLCNRLFRRELIKDVKFTSLLAGEDVVFLTEVFNRTLKIVSVPKYVYRYINREQVEHKSLTHCYSKTMFNEHITAWKLIRSMWQADYASVGDKYLMENTIPYLYNLLIMIPSIEEKCEALSSLNSLLMQLDWQNNENKFMAVFGLNYSEFCLMNSVEYFDYIISLNPKERVLIQFSVGRIGFRYIWKFFIQWFKYKFSGELKK